MKTPSFWTMLGTIGQISQDITEAYSDDNKIDANEIINMGLNLVKKIDLDLDDQTEEYLDIVKIFITWFQAAAVDKKITANEALNLIQTVASRLDYDFEEDGVSWDKS